MADLLTAARAKQAILSQTTFSTDEDTTITSLVSAVSAAVRRWCRREFDSQSFDELYRGTGTDRLVLRQSPLISVSRVSTNPTTVLRVTNTASTNQRATVAVTATGLTLTRVASGTTTTDTSVTFAGNATLSAVATAVNALGNGWSAEAIAPYTLRASADLRKQGAFGCAASTQAGLTLHVEDLADFDADLDRAILCRPAQLVWEDRDPAGWTRDAEYRVLYTAGYASVPEDVQEACARWVAELFSLAKRDPGIRALSYGTGTTTAFYAPKDMPDATKALLATYRTRPI
jgi:hypothetical protein